LPYSVNKRVVAYTQIKHPCLANFFHISCINMIDQRFNVSVILVDVSISWVIWYWSIIDLSFLVCDVFCFISQLKSPSIRYSLWCSIHLRLFLIEREFFISWGSIKRRNQ
jgi:hypothetical protein